MSQVTLTIGGKPHRVSCADGEEAHITKLGAMIDDRLTAMGANLSAQDSQNLLFAALILADELHEANTKTSSSGSSNSDGNRAAARLDQLAQKLELFADKLEASAHTP